MYPSLYSRAHSFILSPVLANKPKWSLIIEKTALAQWVVDELTLGIGKWYATAVSMGHGEKTAWNGETQIEKKRGAIPPSLTDGWLWFIRF